MSESANAAVLAAIANLSAQFIAADRSMTERVDRVAAKIDQTASGLADLSDRVDVMGAKIEQTMLRQIDFSRTLDSVRAAIMDRIDRQQGTIDQLRAEMTVNWQMADAAIRQGRERTAELQSLYDLIASLTRSYQSLISRVEELETKLAAK